NARQPDGGDMTPGEKHRTPPVSEPSADTAALFQASSKSNIYHLLRGYFTSPEAGTEGRACEVEPAPLFVARVQMAFREAIELVRRFKYARRQEAGEGRFIVR
ncbi:MAG: hypothetical protein WBF34_32015, partial [Streptosporangiaceae bacterium]